MRKKIANVQERVRRVWFGSDDGPDALIERSFRECGDCGQSVYVLATHCRECGAEVELLAS